MAPEHKEFIVRCRGIILHENKLLVVRHPGNTSYAALPGGHLEWGEDVRGCISRELVEELGVKPVIGRLLYINNFSDGDGAPSVEFLFEIANSADYVGCEKLPRSHAFELAEILWASPVDDIKILPMMVGEDLKTGTILSDEVRYIS
jgi:ADP-ribose pyrophosphatase YjhB (NUDIX family)